MSNVTLYGFGGSTYVRTARLMLEEKGVPYAHDQTMPNTEAQFARHPFGKIPALAHGDVKLFESLAIGHYIDETFDGPALQPAAAVDRARMLQWITAFLDYVNPQMVRDIIIQRLVVPSRGGQTDEAKVAAAAKVTAKHLAVLNDALSSSPYLAGDSLSLAELFYLPALSYLAKLPEGGMIADNANVASWFERMANRDAYQAAGLAA